MKLNSLQQLIMDFIEKTDRPIFMTGKAGTGKTTFLRYIKANTTKNLAVVAPTAVAAINAGGVTINSFFQVPFGPLVPSTQTASLAELFDKKVGYEKTKLLKCLDLLIIDEISMVRADMIDYIDTVLRAVKGISKPFGGVQLLMIGDLYQLSPVFQKDWHVLRNYYTGPYFFDSLALRKTQLLTFELEEVYRQTDPVFVDILNSVRDGSGNEALLAKLNERHLENATAEELRDYVTLTTHNPLVKQINEQKLAALESEAYTYTATVTDDFPKEAYPAEEELILKVGALVMFIKNDASGKKRYHNGRTAKITALTEHSILLNFLDDGTELEAEREIWQNVKYAFSETDNKVTETNAGSFSQFPLRLAWAITIHKSQGLTFDNALIDVSAAFTHGQAYVALSRCRSLQGMVLLEKVKPANIITDKSVIGFMQAAKEKMPINTDLEQSIISSELGVLSSLYDFSIMILAWNTYKSILLERLSIDLTATEKLLHTEIGNIGTRFIQKELASQNESPWQSVSLKERLQKSSTYFLAKLELLEDMLIDLHQTYPAALMDDDYYLSVNLILEQLKGKTAMFRSLPSAIDTTTILERWKSAAIEYQAIDRWTSTTVTKEAEITNKALYDQLYAWRIKKGKERNTSDYNILSEQVLKDVAAKLPKTLKQFSQIKGVGEGKAFDFGDEILKMVRQYLGEGDLLF
ncbi:HRDC domain-containing protein [Pedobacter xixiisoli]|uniref:HRDC domain-containing protein n=1 Tax=Pedobacter xixiisoli TaxID=1476464 RepID=A0A285ZUL3_9SPHI|nr:HRDC domain-containing protein [Pedobacter xixiisoli]SOD13322.1 HRDC domain-containing protein [Pedobacter xixiisoli]